MTDSIKFDAPFMPWKSEQPTLDLRFVEREVGDRKLPILQQRWRITEGSHGQFGGVNMRFEWRDVPVEEEGA